jgi:uncharacterized protein YbjT (DUF2867 family)
MPLSPSPEADITSISYTFLSAQTTTMPSSTSKKVYVIGATGNIGIKVVNSLLAREVPTTIYVRDVERSRTLFTSSSNAATHLTYVQGDYADLSAFKSSIVDHTRLFLLVADVQNMPTIKQDLGTIAYTAGVKQIVDLSSRFALLDWRTSFIGESHRLAEERLYQLALQHGGTVVSLRPSRFFTNHIWTKDALTHLNAVVDCHPSDLKVEYISIDDIADVATVVLTDPIEKHQSRAYTLIGDSVDGITRASYFEQILNKPIVYKQVTPQELVDTMIKTDSPWPLAYDMATVDTTRVPTDVVPILLGRPYETLESWFIKNKELFV